MKALLIAWKDIMVITRDYKGLAIVLAMPLVLIFILGSALGPMFQGGSTIGAFTVAVVDMDDGEMGEGLIGVLESDGLKELIAINKVKDENLAKDLIIKKKAACAVIIPEGFSEAVLVFSDGAKAPNIQYEKEPKDRDINTGVNSLKILGDPDESLKTTIVKGIVETYAQQTYMVSIGTGIVIEGLNAIEDVNAAPFGRDIAQGLINQTIKAVDVFKQDQEQKNWITSLQYYTASMTMMFVLFGAMLGTKTILEEKEINTINRLFSAGVRKTDIILGKLLGTFTFCILQMSIMILITKYVYHVDWGSSGIGIAAITFSTSLAATGFALIIAAISKTQKMADAFEGIGIQIMSVLGGCMFPFYLFPKILQTISKFTLTRWGLQGYLKLMEGKGIIDIYQSIFALLLMGLLFIGFAIWRLRLE